MFIIANVIIGQSYNSRDILRAFTGCPLATVTGMFFILWLYVFTYIGFWFFGEHKSGALVMVTALGLLYIIILRMMGKSNYWFNTIFTFPAGMVYSVHKEKIEGFIKKNNIVYCIVLIGSVLMCGMLIRFRSRLEVYELMAVVFAVFIVVVTMKVKINNEVLSFLGKYTFDIYIYQRIPMRILSQMIENKYILCAVCFLVTIILAIGFRVLTDKTDAIIYRKRLQ